MTLDDHDPAKPEKPIGLQFRVETPLLYQDYAPALTCVSRWAGLVPDPTQFNSNDEMFKVGDPIARWVPRLTTARGTPELFSDLAQFRAWISDATAAPATSGIAVLIASHHDGNSIYFNETAALESQVVQRRLGRPSLVIMNACGSGKPGQSDFIRRFNENGAMAAIATSTKVDAEMAGLFVSTLLDVAARHDGWPLGELFFETIRDVSRTYNTQTLSYMLLGNAGLRICIPPPVKESR
jgi:hypothetical protein